MANIHALPNISAVSGNSAICAGETAAHGTDVNGCSNSTSIQQIIVSRTGVQELADNTMPVKVYPNPNHGDFTLEITSAAKVTIMDALGRVVLSGTFEAGKHPLSIQEEKAGIYYVHLTENNGEKTVKLIKE